MYPDGEVGTERPDPLSRSAFHLTRDITLPHFPPGPSDSPPPFDRAAARERHYCPRH